MFCTHCQDQYACEQASRCQLETASPPITEKKTPSRKGEATGVELYELLLAGNSLRLSFPSLLEARAFRNYVATMKTRQDKLYIASGLLTEEEVAILSMEFEGTEEVEVHVVISFRSEKKRKKISYEIISGPALFSEKPS